jgi:hypothetical protein
MNSAQNTRARRTRTARGMRPNHVSVAPKLEQFTNAWRPRTAHDIRTMKSCACCGGLGHTHNMVHDYMHEIGAPQSKKVYAHGRCFIEVFGLTLFLNLPQAETDKMQLNDVGIDVMRILVNSRERRRA